MLRQLSIARVEIWFITAGPRHGISQIVRGEDLRHPLEELEGVDVGLNPGREILREGRLSEGVIAGSQRRHKDLNRVDLPSLGIRDLHCLPGVIDKELLSGPILLVEAGIELLGPLVIEAAKLTVLVPLRRLLFVFMPEKQEGDPLPP
jgi:hypothetical protein